jgi:hypothetical protein
VRYISIFIIALIALSLSCKSSLKLSKSEAVPAAVEDKAAKLTSEDCIDPDLSLVSTATQLMLCDGSIASGTYTPPTPDFPDPANVLSTDTVDGSAGTYTPPTPDFPDAGSVLSSDTVDGNAGTLVLPDPWDLRYGTTVGSTTGKLKTNCRNMVDTATWDNSGSLAGGGADVFDTIDDYNGAAAAGGTNTPPYPTTNPWGSDEYLCGYSSLAAAEQTWERVVTAPVTSGTDSVYLDRVSGLNWSRGTEPAANGDVTAHWDNVAAATNTADMGTLGAIEYCANLDLENASAGHGGITGWRLPTQKELMAAYEHGIHDLDDGHTTPDNLGDLDTWFWSSSTLPDATANAWYVILANGYTNNINKTDSKSVLCVAP